jgi:hypothetical protein
MNGDFEDLSNFLIVLLNYLWRWIWTNSPSKTLKQQFHFDYWSFGGIGGVWL